MAKLEELEEQSKVIDGELVDTYEEDTLDVFAATELLGKTRKALQSIYALLNFLSDPTLVKTITNRERVILDKYVNITHELIEETDTLLEDAGE